MREIPHFCKLCAPSFLYCGASTERRNKVISAAEAAELVHSGDTLAITGFATHGCPEALLAALERRFLGVAAGDFFDENHGHAHLAHRGLLKRVIGAHFTASLKFARMLVEDNIEAYNLPLGAATARDLGKPN